jgi:hypothetical protein
MKRILALFMAAVFVCAAVGRIVYPCARAEEIRTVPFNSELAETGLIAVELAAVYFLLFAGRTARNAYIWFIGTAIAALTLYYLATNTTGFAEVFVYLNTGPHIVLHVTYLVILASLLA